MQLKKETSSGIYDTIASDQRGGGVITTKPSGEYIITMVGGKYGTIRYRVELEDVEVQRIIALWELRNPESEKEIQ
jgi:hypothetical protein